MLTEKLRSSGWTRVLHIHYMGQAFCSMCGQDVRGSRCLINRKLKLGPACNEMCAEGLEIAHHAAHSAAD